MTTEQFFKFLCATMSVNPDVLEAEVMYVEVEVPCGAHSHVRTYPSVRVKLANGESYIIGGQKVPEVLQLMLDL